MDNGRKRAGIFPICWRTNTFKNHDFHEKTTKRKTCLSCCFPNGLKNVGTNVNRNSGDEIT